MGVYVVVEGSFISNEVGGSRFTRNVPAVAQMASTALVVAVDRRAKYPVAR
jgi:hypothetical protein